MRLIIAACIAAAASAVWAGTPLPLDEAVRQALAASDALARAGSEVDAAEMRVRQGWAAFSPRVSVSTGYTRMETPPSKTPDFSAIPANPFLSPAVFAPLLPRDGEFDTRLQVVVPVYAGGARSAALSMRKGEKGISEAQLNAARAGIIMEVTEKYYTLLKLEESLRTAAENEKMILEHRDRAERLQAEGLGTRLQVTGFEVQLKEAEQGVLNLRLGVRLARQELAALLARDDADGFEPEPVADIPPQREYDARQVEDAAVARREELKALGLAAGIAGSAVKAARAGYLPAVNAAYVYGWQEEQYAFDADNRYWRLAGTVEMNLFSGGMDHYKTGEARCREEGARRQLEEMRTSVRLQASQALQRYRQAYQLREVAAARLRLAEENYTLASEGFGQGVADELQEKDARTALTRARTAYAAAGYDVLIADARLAWVTGTLTRPDERSGNAR